MTATQEFVVPKSIPIIFPILNWCFFGYAPLRTSPMPIEKTAESTRQQIGAKTMAKTPID
jgi:hypothetical protein